MAWAQKKAHREGRLIVFVDESGLSQRLTRVRTCAIKGETPVVQFHFNWDQLSVIAGMHFTGACFRFHDGTIKKEQSVELLKALKVHFRRPLLITGRAQAYCARQDQIRPTTLRHHRVVLGTG